MVAPSSLARHEPPPLWRHVHQHHQQHHQQHHHHQQARGLSTSAPPPTARNDDGDGNAADHDQQQQQQPTFVPIYRGKWILPVRLLVRAKVFQLAGFGSVALAASLAAAGDLSPTDAALLAALTLGCAGSAYSLWYYSSRYVGELSVLLPPPPPPPSRGGGRTPTTLTLRLSALDFWGNRADVRVDARRVLPVVRGGGRTRAAEVERLTSQVLFPVNVAPRGEVAGIDDDDDEEEEEEGEASSGDGRERRRAGASAAAAAAAVPLLPAGERRQFYLSAVAGASPYPRLLMALLDGSLVAARPWERRPRTAEELERAVVAVAEGGRGDGGGGG